MDRSEPEGFCECDYSNKEGASAPGLFVSIAGCHLNSQKINRGKKTKRPGNGF